MRQLLPAAQGARRVRGLRFPRRPAAGRRVADQGEDSAGGHPLSPEVHTFDPDPCSVLGCAMQRDPDRNVPGSSLSAQMATGRAGRSQGKGRERPHQNDAQKGGLNDTDGSAYTMSSSRAALYSSTGATRGAVRRTGRRTTAEQTRSGDLLQPGATTHAGCGLGPCTWPSIRCAAAGAAEEPWRSITSCPSKVRTTRTSTGNQIWPDLTKECHSRETMKALNEQKKA